MKTRRVVFSMVLLMATMFSPIFAQSAGEAAKYGELKEIQVSEPGKLGKSIKKADPTITALKVVGELNEKDLEVIFSLPNIAYLDLSRANSIAAKYEYKEGKEKKRIDLTIVDDQNHEKDFLLMCSSTLKFLALPEAVAQIVVPLDYSYSLDMLVVDGKYNRTGMQGHRKHTTPSNLSFTNVRVRNKNGKTWIYDDGDDALTKIHRKNSVGYLESYDEKIQNVSGSGRYISQEKRDNVRTLYIPTESALKWSVVEKFNPEEIIVESTGKKILNKYNGGSNADVSEYDEIREYAFAQTGVVTVSLGNKIKKLPRGCFYNCKSLTTINMPAVEEFGEYALEGAISLAMSEYVLPENVQELDVTSLPSGIKVINITKHKYAPTLNNYEPKKCVWMSGVIFTTEHTFMDLQELKDVEFIVPKGSLKKYQTGNWKYLHIVEEGATTEYSFQLDSVGALKNFLTEDIIPNVKKLTLKGVMGETDFEWIRKCKNLKYLDISGCFTFEETQAAKERYSVQAVFWKMVAQGVEYSRNMNRQMYDNQEISTEEAVKREEAAQIAKSFLPETMSQEEIDNAFGNDRVIWRKECYYPEFAFEGLCWLEQIILPQKLVAINKALFASKDEMQHLQKVQFSDEVMLI